ncbi:MAG TPA: transcriptional regulator [Planctomycetaceae bacterium]|nr:transcriptional regulator [Planctomycetaceae bacterium]
MKAVLDSKDRQFLERLHRLGPATVQDMCADLGVTSTAVRQRLVRLHERGLVGRDTVRHGRGRPHHTYEVTETGLRELGDNYADLALILWREIRSIQEPEVRGRLLGRVRDALVDRFGRVSHEVPLAGRIDELRSALDQRGYDVEVDHSGLLPVLRENNCPYLELAETDSAICELEHAVFEKVLGTELTLTHCRLDGHRCCEFQPTNPQT